MSTLQEWIAKLVEESAKGPLPDVNVTFPPPVVTYTVDGNCLTTLPGITNQDYVNVLHSVSEIVDKQTVGSPIYGVGRANVIYANTAYITEGQFIGVAHEGAQRIDQTTGNPTWYADQSKPIANSRAWPALTHRGYNLATVAGVVAWVNSLAPAVTNHGEGFGP